jgi:cytochrome P450
MSVSSYFQGWVSSPPVLRTAFGVLRAVKPIAKFGKTVIVTRYTDVVDILKRQDDFTVHEIDGYKMEIMGTPFVLGMDSSPEANRDANILMQVIKREDLTLVRTLIKKFAAELIEKSKPQKSIDTVNGYARLAAVRIVAAYFGVPADEPAMMRWQRSIFNEAFVNLKNDKTIHEQGMIAAKEINEHALNLIHERQQQQTPLEDNILNRLINKQKDNPWLDDAAVKRNILGTILGVVENTSKVVTQVIDQLLKRPEVFEKVRQAALNDDIDTVRNYCFEALRFNPHNPVILRFCKNAAVVGAGTSYERKIPAGSTIYAATLSAMFDDKMVSKPKEFNPNRKVDYLHFGYGVHACTGRFITEVTVPELVAGLLRLTNLRRADGKAGKIEYVDVVFPKTYTLKFD